MKGSDRLVTDLNILLANLNVLLGLADVFGYIPVAHLGLIATLCLIIFEAKEEEDAV